MNREAARKKYQLREEQKKELVQRYYDGESTKVLIAEFNLQGLETSQITYLFDDIITDIQCEYCGLMLQKEPHTRSSSEKDAICPGCGHTIYTSNFRHCFCVNCVKKTENKKKEIEELKERNICKILDCEHEKDNYPSEELTGWEKLILGSLITFAMDEDLQYIQPLESFSRCLFANSDKSNEILKAFYHKGILILGNKYYIDAFILNEQYEPKSYTVNQIFYEIWVDDDEICKKLLNPKPFLDKNQILLFWRDLNKAEAIEYLLKEFQKVGIKYFSPGKKTEELFVAMVEKFSLSQIYRIIRYITDKTAKDILSGEKNYQHAANAAIMRMESYYKRALHENYSLYIVKYENDLSMATTYFYNKILNMGESAFYSVPNIELKQETILKSEGE